MAIVYVIIYGPVRALTQFRFKIEKKVYEYKTVICLLSSDVDIFEHFSWGVRHVTRDRPVTNLERDHFRV